MSNINWFYNDNYQATTNRHQKQVSSGNTKKENAQNINNVIITGNPSASYTVSIISKTQQQRTH